MSSEEAGDPEYGFIRNFPTFDVKCRAAASDYAVALGIYRDDKTCTEDGRPASPWWLRSFGNRDWNQGYVKVGNDWCHFGAISAKNHSGVRPAMSLNVKKIIK